MVWNLAWQYSKYITILYNLTIECKTPILHWALREDFYLHKTFFNKKLQNNSETKFEKSMNTSVEKIPRGNMQVSMLIN